MIRKIKLPYYYSVYANFSTKVEIDARLRDSFESKEYKPRNHPGRTKVKIAAIPPDILKGIKVILEDTGAKSLIQESENLYNYLRSRKLPPEESEINEKAANIHKTVSHKFYSQLTKDRSELSQEEIDMCEKKIQTSVFNVLKRNVYSWANISYDKPTCLQYLISRAAAEYAILVRIFDEINRKIPDYKPRSFFDFGSGVGTGTWAVNTYWKKHIFEYFCVDTSLHMNDLSRLILCEGKDNVPLPFKAYFQRQFLPASTDLKYNIVLSAFSLFEMPNMKTRLETVQKLWNKTEDFLIIVEQGTNAGFKIVNEAREFVLNGTNVEKGYAFAPCPNDSVCPRYLEHETPCNFLMKYETLKFPSKVEIQADLFTYVILRKGVRPTDDSQWPRIVRAPIVRSRHTVCRLCTAQGELKEIIFSKGKFDTTTYRCARSSNWGDLLPVK
ncbi:PREDICTED: methyltransferase-like protein 17, mitochondrial [Papilio polytes]|uniref:methyltransferase-like protein 17, mitochondrial n=1 Tax=Papilio polytes TaxID=76194 RepID=UPI000676587C|nr:PREDICTED: methyltransferase-like protein 17, mitochondrial [Papilio polytes]